MSSEVELWTISDLIANAPHIELNPAYQRGPAWRPEKQSLLLDSIFRKYDLPKIYLAKKGASLPQKYEVIDGQQRVRAILDFASNGLAIAGDSLGRTTSEQNINYSDLSDLELGSFMDYQLTLTIITGATATFKRTLFERLQLGERLNSAELRNALPSAAPLELRSIATTHQFFAAAGISNSRYKREDYLTHIFAYLDVSNRKQWRDIKAPTLRKFILERARGLKQDDLRNVDDVLNFLHQVVRFSQKSLRNKWSFVDTAIFCLKRVDQLSVINPADFGRALSRIEQARKDFYRTSDELLKSSCRVSHKRELYDYIGAYKTGTALKESLRSREIYLEKTLER